MNLYQPLGRERTSIKQRTVIFSLSVLLHGLAVWAGIRFLSPIEVYDNTRIHHVVLVSRAELFLPPDYPHGSSDVPEKGEGIVEPGSDPDLPAAGAPAQAGGGRSADSEPGRPTAGPQLGIWARQFRLSLPPIDSEKLSSDFSLELLRPPQPVSHPEYIDLNKFLPSRSGSGYGGPSLSGAGGGGRRPGVISRSNQVINISPWAENVLEELQKNWFLSPADRDTFVGEVEMVVTVAKNGGVLKMEIRRSSQSVTLDEAALKAIELTPFPSLPEDFPEDFLEIRLVFNIQ